MVVARSSRQLSGTSWMFELVSVLAIAAMISVTTETAARAGPAFLLRWCRPTMPSPRGGGRDPAARTGQGCSVTTVVVHRPGSIPVVAATLPSGAQIVDPPAARS